MAEPPAAGGAAPVADEASKEEKKKKKELEIVNKNDLKNFPDNYPKQNFQNIKVYREEKFQLEYLRRWRIVVRNLAFFNLSEVIDPFIQINIGGDYQETTQKIKDGTLIKHFSGQKKIIIQSEALLAIEKNQMKEYELKYEGELDLSYQELEDQFLIWDHCTMSINYLYGYLKESLAQLACNKIHRMETISLFPKYLLRPLCKLQMSFLFQEIRDYTMSFINWQLRKDLTDNYPQNLNPVLKFIFYNNGIKSNSIRSEPAGERNQPQWSSIKGSLYYRGAISELEQQLIGVELYDHYTIGYNKLVQNQLIIYN